MKIADHIFQKYFQKMVLDQLQEEYKSKGWKVMLERKVGTYKVDMVARKEGRTIVLEIKIGEYTEKQRKKVERLRQLALENDFEFRLVIANPPKEQDIEVIGLDHLLYEHLLENIPSELDALSSATTINDVYDVEISSLIINERKNIEVIGSGIVGITLQYGGSGDSTSMGDSYPFTFVANLAIDDGAMRIEDVEEIDVDTSSFYE